MKAKIKVPENTKLSLNKDYYDLGDSFGDVVPVEINNKVFKVLSSDEVNTFKIDLGDREIWVDLKAFSKKSQVKLLEKFGYWKNIQVNGSEIFVNLKTLNMCIADGTSVNLEDVLAMVSHYKNMKMTITDGVVDFIL